MKNTFYIVAFKIVFLLTGLKFMVWAVMTILNYFPVPPSKKGYI